MMLKHILEYLENSQRNDLLRRIESMKLFEHNGEIHYGKWREWWNAAPDEKRRLLAAFQSQNNA